MKKGDTVTIYFKHITREDKEGEARLVEQLKEPQELVFMGEKYLEHYWDVTFKGEDFNPVPRFFRTDK